MGLIFLAIFFALSVTNSGFPSFSGNTIPLSAGAQKDCSYRLETQAVNTSAAAIANDLYDQKWAIDNSKWILVKRDAKIPNFKVTAGANVSTSGREMDILQQVDEGGAQRWAFIALGHCKIDQYGNAGSGCFDPLTTVVIYVLQSKGTDTTPVYPQATSVPVTDANYWTFNVYVSEKLLTDNNGGPNYGNDDVPCWITQCAGGDLRADYSRLPGYDLTAWNLSCQGTTPPPAQISSVPAPNLGTSLAPGEDYPPSFIKRSWVTNPGNIPGSWGALAEYTWFAGKIDALNTTSIPYGSFKGKLGVKDVTFDVYAQRMGTALFGDTALVLKPLDRNIYYLYMPTDFSDSTQGETLKLRTFRPAPGFVYEWWYPSCKPVIYLYPEKETSFDVKLKPFGIVTDSIPSYPWLTGWKNVLAKPNGELTYNGQKFDYLYYEGRSFFVKVPKEGFVVRGSELSGVFDAILPQLGLIDRESADFKEYWLGRLNSPEDYYQISILPREEIDRVEPMELKPAPDTLIRVRLFFKKLDRPQLLPLPVLPATVGRSGTTIVDWGGFFK